MELSQAIGAVCKAVISSMEAVDVFYATFTGSSLAAEALPYEIPMEMVDVMPLFSENGMTFSGDISQAGGAQKITGAEITLCSPLAAGDRVMAVRHHGGRRYFVVCRI